MSAVDVEITIEFGDADYRDVIARLPEIEELMSSIQELSKVTFPTRKIEKPTRHPKKIEKKLQKRILYHKSRPFPTKKPFLYLF